MTYVRTVSRSGPEIPFQLTSVDETPAPDGCDGVWQRYVITQGANTIVGVRDSPPGQPAAGIDVEPDDRGQPALDVHIVGNTIRGNAGPGVMLELESNDGPAVVATNLEISGNTIVENALKRSPPKRAGIVLAGGQDGGQGTLVLKDNTVRGNGGPGVLGSRLRLVVQASGNDLGGNEGGPSRGL